MLFLGEVSDVGDEVVQDSQHPVGSLAQNNEDAKMSSRKIIVPATDDNLASCFILNLVLRLFRLQIKVVQDELCRGRAKPAHASGCGFDEIH